MAQYRAIHTKITQSFDFNEMPDDFTRLMWVLLPLGLDKEGRGIFNTSWIRSKLFPLREDVTAKRISDAFDWMIARGMVICYEVDGRQYFWVPTFTLYQRTDKEANSVLPSPELLQNNSGTTPELVQSNSCLNDIKGNDIKEKEKKAFSPAFSTNFTDSRPIIEINYVQTWFAVTGQSGIPASSQEKVIQAIDTLRAKYQTEAELIAYLKPYYDFWLTKKTKDGRAYSKSNCAWLYDLAIAGDPLPSDKKRAGKPDPKCPKCNGMGVYSSGEKDIHSTKFGTLVKCDCVKVIEEVNV